KTDAESVRMSASCSVAAAGTFSRRPVARLSSTCTSSPRASSASATCEPMKPAPPVTSARTGPYRRFEVFVTFEGIDGSGKSTQAELLAEGLRADGHDVVMTREPGGTRLGEQIRELLLNGQDMSPWAEAALFAAARAELVEPVIVPALESGKVRVCDRYVDSALAYRGIARGLGIDEVLQLNEHATGGLFPDRTFLVLVDPATASARARASDRIERESDEFHRRVDHAYRELATMFPDRITAVDGDQPADEIAEEIRGRVRQLS